MCYKVESHSKTQYTYIYEDSLFLCFLFYSPFLKLIVACRLHVIYVREDNDSNV